MRKSLIWLLMVVLSITLVVTFSLVGYGEKAEVKEGPFTLAWVAKGLGHPYFNSCFEGAKEAAAEYGNEIFEVGPDDWSVEGQIAIVESLIDQKVDCIGIAANDLDTERVLGEEDLTCNSFQGAYGTQGCYDYVSCGCQWEDSKCQAVSEHQVYVGGITNEFYLTLLFSNLNN